MVNAILCSPSHVYSMGSFSSVYYVASWYFPGDCKTFWVVLSNASVVIGELTRTVRKNFILSFLAVYRQATYLTYNSCYAQPQCVMEPIFLLLEVSVPPLPKGGLTKKRRVWKK